MSELWDTVMQAIAPFEVPIWVAVYIGAGFLLRFILVRVIDRSVEGIVSGVKRRRGADSTQQLVIGSPVQAVRTVQRTRTIGSVLRNIATTAILIVVVLLVVNRIDPKVLPSLTILTAAMGAGLGFGAQRIVADVLNGLFMVIEDQLGVGDDVDMELASGVVERVGVRVTQIRDVKGTLWFVRNGEVKRVGNESQGWNRAILDLAVPYELDRRRVEQVLVEAAESMAQDVDWIGYFLDRPRVWGMQTLSAEAVVLRLAAKVRPGTASEVERELRARIQDAFKRAGIRLPELNTIVFNGPNGIAPALDWQDKRAQAERARAERPAPGEQRTGGRREETR